MIFYPIQTLISLGITEILIIISPEYAGHFLNLLGSGQEFGVRFTYEIQEEPRGLSEAFIIGETFIADDSVAMILGDNIFDEDFTKKIASFKKGALIFAKEVPDAKRYGVIEFDEKKNVLSLTEKPDYPKSNYAMVGLYILDNRAAQYAKRVKPSPRGELEIIDLINQYKENNELRVEFVTGLWEDAGTFDSLLRINNLMADKAKGEIL